MIKGGIGGLGTAQQCEQGLRATPREGGGGRGKEEGEELRKKGEGRKGIIQHVYSMIILSYIDNIQYIQCI